MLTPALRDKMQRLCVYVLIVVLALAAFSEASWKPHSHLQDAPLDPGANRGQEPHLSKKQGPWVEEEEEAYGWMDFGRRSAEEGDLRP
ncbi:Gastrin, partial [Eschrichtius robustus]|nr:Gastrin [Eschrichtius robustus]